MSKVNRCSNILPPKTTVVIHKVEPLFLPQGKIIGRKEAITHLIGLHGNASPFTYLRYRITYKVRESNAFYFPKLNKVCKAAPGAVKRYHVIVIWATTIVFELEITANLLMSH